MSLLRSPFLLYSLSQCLLADWPLMSTAVVKPILIPTTNGTQEGQFSLIHIPLELYSMLLQPLLRVLLPHSITASSSDEPLETQHPFLNISITPLECSIVCHASLTTALFTPFLSTLPQETAKQVTISKETYIAFSVSSAGMEAGQRVIDLTAPLAMAGIPIFFITTYYTDFILVPSKDRHTVGQALLARGFEFSENDSAYVAPMPISHSRGPSTASDPPSTPPPSNVAELQIRTFALLKRRNVVPFVEKDLHLVQCSGKDLPTSYHSSNSPPNGYHGARDVHKHKHSNYLNTLDPALYIGLISALLLQPRFLSLTLAQDDAPSLLLDKSLLWLFGNSIAGDTDGDLVPIFLDLGDLPLESTGIVCGVAGKVVEEMRFSDGTDGDGPDWEGGGAELSYLSTARAGAVILSGEGSVKALEALGPLLERGGL